MKPPADMPLSCACASLRRAARAVSQRYDAALKPAGLRATQFTLLQVLARMGMVRQSMLEYVLASDTSTLTRTLRPLAAKGWIRSAPGQDRRERWWSITRQGKTALERAQPAWEAVQAQLEHRVGPERWAALLAELAELSFAART